MILKIARGGANGEQDPFAGAGNVEQRSDATSLGVLEDIYNCGIDVLKKDARKLNSHSH
jgi:hypothetical protein